MRESLRVGDEVAGALVDHQPVVALESTIFSRLGLPSPANSECLERVIAAIRIGGAVPALTGVIDGQAIVGASDHQADRLLEGSRKIAARDLGPALGERLDVGVTTVSASLTLAAAAGIETFATGGIGGVHRGAELTGDVSHDLVALSRHPVMTVSSGAKAFLDLARTLEYLETLGVPVVGWKTDRFPAFYVRDSGFAVPRVAECAHDVVRLFRAGCDLGHPGGVLVANPIPEEDELSAPDIDRALDEALAQVQAEGLAGPEVTPVVLEAVAELTVGKSVPANLALAESNARVATELAIALVEVEQ